MKESQKFLAQWYLIFTLNQKRVYSYGYAMIGANGTHEINFSCDSEKNNYISVFGKDN